MLKSFVLPLVAVTALAGPVFAQDTTPIGNSFSGPRAEIFGGYLHSQSRFRSNGAAAVAPVIGNRNQDSGVAGVELGYDIPLGDRFVAGPLGSYSISTTSAGSCVGTPTACVRPEMDWSAGGRFGAKMGDKALLYVKGAYVKTRMDSRRTIGAVRVSDHDWRGGLRAGIGAEYAIAPHAYVKAEYNYTRTDRVGLGQQGLPGSSLRLNRQAALAGFGVRF